MTQAPLITAIAPWFGGKRTLAPDIVAELGRHRAFFDPFCGGLSVLLAKPLATMETVNDLHGDLINLARVVQDPRDGAALYRRLRRVLMCEGLMNDSADRLREPFTPGVERAFHYFVVSWMGRNGISGTLGASDPTFAIRYTPGGGQGGQRFRSAVSSIPGWRRRLERVVITQRDGFEFFAKVDDIEGVVVYLDPPYPPETRASADSDAGRYVHEFSVGDGGMFSAPDDHTRLAEISRRFKKTRIVVSSYDCPRYRELYAGWTFLDKTRQKNLHSQNGRGARPKEAPEVLIINGPSYTEGSAA